MNTLLASDALERICPLTLGSTGCMLWLDEPQSVAYWVKFEERPFERWAWDPRTSREYRKRVVVEERLPEPRGACQLRERT